MILPIRTAAIGILATSFCLSQEGPQPIATSWMKLSFSRVSGRAGEEVALPIYLLSNANGKEPFKILIPFLASQATFKELETGLLARKAGWTLGAQVKEGEEDPDTKILEIAVRPGEASFFPSGVVAYVHFVIGEHVPQGDIILDASLEPSGTAPFEVKAEPGKITVYTEAIYGCFFYMH